MKKIKATILCFMLGCTLLAQRNIMVDDR